MPKNLQPKNPDHVNGIGRMEVLKWNVHRAFRLDGPTIAEIECMTTE